ncbi:hypothetical protein BKA57DRAFT_434266 [Linnemannia elongata]|nr:hypothetical protein BKA57DRAFT_434266 [Linnemannia elongata]
MTKNSTVRPHAPGDGNDPVFTIAPEDSSLPTPLAIAKSISDIFLENLPKPVIKTDLPALVDRIEVTQQLVYCCRLLIDSQAVISLAVSQRRTGNQKNEVSGFESQWTASMGT